MSLWSCAGRVTYEEKCFWPRSKWKLPALRRPPPGQRSLTRVRGLSFNRAVSAVPAQAAHWSPGTQSSSLDALSNPPLFPQIKAMRLRENALTEGCAPGKWLTQHGNLSFSSFHPAKLCVKNPNDCGQMRITGKGARGDWHPDTRRWPVKRGTDSVSSQLPARGSDRCSVSYRLRGSSPPRICPPRI